MPTQFSLMSVELLALSLVAVVLLGVLDGRARQVAFLAINLFFLFGILLGRDAWVAATFSVAGYVLARFVMLERRWAFRIGLAACVLSFVYLRNYEILAWILPEDRLARTLSTVGLSFLFFRVVHVLIEARSGTLGEVDFFTFSNYCLSFTTFLMGPIQRYQDFREQWRRREPAIAPGYEPHLDAVLRILLGLVKAYVLAELMAPLLIGPTTNVGRMPIPELLLRVYAFYLFLYFNFSGYCDVVIGVGSLIGVRPPENFDKPFLAVNISDFWLRMHRSLTLWLTDYVFSPTFKRALTARWIGERPLLAMSLALMVTMLVSGVWHGTTLAFLVFGALHGAYLVVYRLWEAGLVRVLGRRGAREWHARPAVRAGGWLLTFNAVSFAFVLFQLDWDRAVLVYSRFLPA